jgi:hypothetical protein
MTERVTVTRFSRISKNPIVPAKVKLVFETMQNDPAMTAQLAAKAVGISYYNFRRALKLPHVALWLLLALHGEFIISHMRVLCTQAWSLGEMTSKVAIE